MAGGKNLMKCLSIRQPWACLVMGPKDVENRSWKTDYRGPLLIHAGLKYDPQGLSRQYIYEHGLFAGRLIKGAIIGRVTLVDCVKGHPSKWAAPDCWNWILADPWLIKPIPYKGRLGLFDVPDVIVEGLR